MTTPNSSINKDSDTPQEPEKKPKATPPEAKKKETASQSTTSQSTSPAQVTSEKNKTAKETSSPQPTPEAKQPTTTRPKDARPIALVIDDEFANRDMLVRLITQAKYDVKGAGSGEEANKTLEELDYPPDVIIVDHQLPDTEGIDLIKIYREKYPSAKIGMATMHDDRTRIDKAFENGADFFLVKPHGFMELFQLLQKLSQDPTCLNQIVFSALGKRPYRR